MTSVVKFQALSGVYDESPPCYLLQVDEFRFMLDCGWDHLCDATYLAALRSIAHEVDAVLLSFGDVAHLGALPYLVGKCGLRCPIYATLPVQKLGQMFLYDAWQSYYNAGEFDLFSLDDIDTAIERIHAVKYQQSISLKGRGSGLQLTALPAGHMLGGTMWKVVKEGGEEEVVYAVDYNHQKEKHVNGAAFEQATRPSVLITDASNALYSSVRRIERTEQLITTIVETLRGGGDVLVATDSAGRCLELCLVLEQLWSIPDSGLQHFGLALVTHTARATLEACRSLIEWSSEKLLAAFEKDRANPFDLRFVRTAHALDQLGALPSPRLILASHTHLDAGFARDLFLQLAAAPRNAIVLTARPARRSLAARLLQLARAHARPADAKPSTSTPAPDADAKQSTQREPFEIDVQVTRRVRLEGDELAEFLRVENERKRRELLARTHKRRARRPVEEDDTEEDDDDDDSETESSLNSRSESDSDSAKLDELAAPDTPQADTEAEGDNDVEVLAPAGVIDIDEHAETEIDTAKDAEPDGEGEGNTAVAPHLVLSAEQLESIANRTARLSVVHEVLEQQILPEVTDTAAIPFISPTAVTKRRSTVLGSHTELDTDTVASGVGLDEQSNAATRTRSRKRTRELDGAAIHRSDADGDGDKLAAAPAIPVKRKQPISFFKRDQRVRSHLMFAFAEPKSTWDEYGEFLRPNEIRMHDPNALAEISNGADSRPANLESGPPRRDEAESRANEDADAEAEVEPEVDWSNNVSSSILLDDVPSKCVTARQRVTVAARVELIELEGRSDGDSVRKIMQQIKPREVILVRGNDASTRALADFITSISAPGTARPAPQPTRAGTTVRVHAPRLFELVDATQEGRLVQVRLRDALLASVHLSQVKNDVQLGWIDALLHVPAGYGQQRRERTDELMHHTGSSALPTLAALAKPIDHASVLVNEPRLSDLKQTLLRRGVTSEFSGGQLIVKDSIAVRKTELGKLHIDAALTEDFFAVRDILYEQYVHI